MKALFDINIWIDIAARPIHYPDSAELFIHLLQKRHSIQLPLCGYTTIYYLLGQLIGEKGAREFLDSLLLRSVQFITFSKHELMLARKLKLRDLEDACIVASALNAESDVIVSRNSHDFRNSPIETLSPKQLLQQL